MGSISARQCRLQQAKTSLLPPQCSATINSVVSYAGKPIVILSLTSLFNGALTETIFCFVLKLLIATYVANAVDEKK